MDSKKCKHIGEDGTPCGAYALSDKDFCFSHDPESREAKALAVRKGGLVKQIKIEGKLDPVKVEKPEDIVTLLATTIEEVREGKLDPRIANTIGYLSSHLIKAFEFIETDSKLEEIRSVLLQRKPVKERGY